MSNDPLLGDEPDDLRHYHSSRPVCWRGRPLPMERAHRHDDIELNLVEDGELRYLFGGDHVHVEAGSIVLFWAAVPHQLISATSRSTVWLVLPLRDLLRMSLPETALSQLLSGIPLRAPTRSGDRELFTGWAEEVAGPAAADTDTEPGDGDLAAIAGLEIEARIRRLARDSTPATGATAAPSGVPVRRAAQMAQFITTNFREPITVAEIAAHVHLHPQYAMTTFRRVTGSTLGDYLTQRRLAEAVRLLVAGDSAVTEIVSSSGFGSLSRFYACFRARYGCSPSAYRRLRN